jgi:hypothetical protein
MPLMSRMGATVGAKATAKGLTAPTSVEHLSLSDALDGTLHNAAGAGLRNLQAEGPGFEFPSLYQIYGIRTPKPTIARRALAFV